MLRSQITHLPPPAHCDIAIIGGGLIGASLAIALAASPEIQARGWDIRVLEPQAYSENPQEQPSFDGRASALSYASYQHYRRWGLAQALEHQGAPIENIHISERGRWGHTHLSAQEEGIQALGYVIENHRLGRLLMEKLNQQTQVHVHTGWQVHHVKMQAQAGVLQLAHQQAQTQSLQAKLVVLADGGRSPLKQQLGIEDHLHDYQQDALITSVQISRPHRGWAYERFTPAGPLALLPLASPRQQQMALVWTRPPEVIADLMQLDEYAFCQQLQSLFGHHIGRFQQIGPRARYPLRLIRAQEQVRSRLVLVGNAAHYLHPVAGQGYNLGVRGVADLSAHLTKVAAQGADPGSLEPLLAYAQQREADQARVIGFSHALIEIFTNQTPGLAQMRSQGLTQLGLHSLAKTWFTRKAMGL